MNINGTPLNQQPIYWLCFFFFLLISQSLLNFLRGTRKKSNSAPSFMCSKVHAKDNYWKKNKNVMIHVLLPPYSPKSIQYIVSAGQIVFELDKKPAVQSLFCKTDFQHCRWFPWFPFCRIPLHFICVCKQRCENPKRLFHIIVSERVSGHLPKKKAVGVGIKGGKFRMISSVQERGGVSVWRGRKLL